MRGLLLALPLVALVVVAGARAGTAPVPGGPFPNLGPPLLLRLEGVLQPTREAARAAGFDIASFDLAGEARGPRRYLGVTLARTVGGDHPLDGKDVLALVAPFDPSFLIVGPDRLVARLRDTPPGTRILIEGLVAPGSRTFLLRRVDQERP
jgi:hypothetical protein